MSEIANRTMELFQMLPEDDQELAFEIIKKLVLAWDPDYTKLTESELESLKEAEKGPFINSKDIDWDDLSDIE